VTWRAALCLAFACLAQAALAWQPAEIAAGRGLRGPWQQNESRYDYVDDPTVALDHEGQAFVAWVDQGAKDVFVNGVNASRSGDTFSWLPRLALAPGRLYVLWQEIIFSGGSHGGEMLFAVSEDGGRSFSQPLNLSNSVAGDGKGRITRDLWHNGSYDRLAGPGGEVDLAWTEYEGALWFARSRDGGKTFSPRIQVNAGQARPARGPSLARGRDGTLYLAWTDGDVHLAASRDDGGSFDSPRTLTRTPAYTDAPSLAVDAHGGLHLAYAERGRILLASGTLEAPRELVAGGAGFPALAADGRGSLHLIWEVFPAARQRPRGLGYSVSRDAGRTFSAPAVLPNSPDPSGAPNGSFQGLLMRKLAVNRRGDVAVVNSSLKDGERSRVWRIR
jgi:hypothetical protein